MQQEKKSLPISEEPTKESIEEPYDYSQDWSDYDWWGYDGNKRKRNEEGSSHRRATDLLGQLLGFESNRNEKRQSAVKGFSIQNNQIYENRKRRKLGSMR